MVIIIKDAASFDVRMTREAYGVCNGRLEAIREAINAEIVAVQSTGRSL